MIKRSALVVVAAVGVSGLLALAPGAASAQSLRPNILVIFDTSGSMLYSQSLDGSPLCNTSSTNTTNGQTSRIYRLKNALRQALEQVGTDEANFGLMRFAQTETPNSLPVCPRGHYNQGSGGGCRMSTDVNANNVTTAETAYGSWFDTGASEVLLVPVTKAATGLKPLAASDFDPDGGNISAVYRWIDQTETAGAVTVITDPELRSPPNNSTPLGRSLYYARLYFNNYVKAKDAMGKPIDPRSGCRTNLIIVVTDGAEMCDTTKGSALNLTTCAQTGYATYNPEVQACNLNVGSKVPTYLLTDAGLTPAEKIAANAIAAAGGTSQAIFVTLTDTAAVKQALIDIIAKTVPPAETCNGKDDNCNGLIDEGVSNLCPVSNNASDPDNLLGTAAKHCALETCNCQDDNCNGQIDEGFPPNACGQGCGCAVPKEVCNGLDDNCDGDIDEGFSVGMACDNGLKGACHRTGITACNAAGTGTFCDAPVVTPSQEVCNNIDDNCDGQVDEGLLPGIGVACGSSLGSCQAGVTACVNGRIVCSAVSMPGTEICNGIDDNCDGVVDNGTFPETGMDCLCAGLSPSQVGVGLCKSGHLICRGTRGFVCEGCVGPTAEICDGKDNDCDGTVDVAAMCPSGLGCKEGQCAVKCRPGEVPCSGNFKCVNDFCVPTLCVNVSCPTDTRCDEMTGKCVDVCATVTCSAPRICQHGACVDCYTLGCDTGQTCVAGRCQVDKCLGVTCPAKQYCDNGTCVDLCLQDKCAATDRCVAGQCMPDTCATVGCADSQFCDTATGECRVDPCSVRQCGRGEICVKQTGRCVADPCATIACPGPCWQCTLTSDGVGTCGLSGDCREVSTKVGLAGGGRGCGCAVGASGGGGAGASIAAAALMLAASFARRRRRRIG